MTDEIVKYGGKHLFPKGVSGNLNGRPKGSKNKISYTVVDALERQAKEGGDRTNLEEMIEMLLTKALQKGDLKAVEILLDRGYGKAKEFVEVSTPEIQIIDSLGDDEEENDSVGGIEVTSSKPDEGIQE
jgi:hypothetical protein